MARENMPRGKAVRVDLMKRARAANRAAENQTGASGPRSVTPWRWRVLAGSLVGQERMACLRVSGASWHLGHVVGQSSSQAGCARR